MSADHPPDNKAHTVPDAKLHKGYLWALVAALLVGAGIYFSNETRNFTDQQKFYFWALEEQYSHHVKAFAERHTLQQLENLCRSASKHANASGAIFEQGSEAISDPSVMEKAIQQNTTDICNAYIYKLKRKKIKEGDLEGMTF